MFRRLFGVLLASSMLILPFDASLARNAESSPAKKLGRCASDARSDATVVAVIDFGIVPYHWDFVDSKMPQATDNDPCNDLPLSKAPHKWLRGFPGPKAFDSYTALNLKLDKKNADTQSASLDQADAKKWDAVKASDAKSQHFYWMPETKVIGALAFGSNKIHGVPGDHGAGTTSVSVGNIHGTCPECLLMFIDIDGASVAQGEAAINWAMKQPWIDVITNSYGFSTAVRDRIYSGSNVGLQREASDRGQTIFFSAGNGNDGSYVVPNTTSFSSQEGPDWIVTVGAISPGNHGSYQGHGKPADIASIGSDYPASYGSATVGGTGSGGFGGTSNATPTIAGIYGRALYEARRALEGAELETEGWRDRRRRLLEMWKRAQRLRIEGREADRRRDAHALVPQRRAHRSRAGRPAGRSRRHRRSARRSSSTRATAATSGWRPASGATT